MVYIIVIFVALVVLILAATFSLIIKLKNDITLKIRLWFIDNNYNNYYKLPSYNRMMWNLRRWTIKSWKRWIKRNKKNGKIS